MMMSDDEVLGVCISPSDGDKQTRREERWRTRLKLNEQA